MLFPINPGISPFGTKSIGIVPLYTVQRVNADDIIKIYELNPSDPRQYSTVPGGEYEIDENKIYPNETFICLYDPGTPELVWEGATFGSEKVVNGTYDTDITGTTKTAADETSTWTHNTTSPITGSGDGKLSVSVAGTNDYRPSLSISHSSYTTGKIYTLSFKTKLNSGLARIRGARNGTVSTISLSKILSGTQTTTLTNTSENDSLAIYFDGRNIFEIQIDDISLKEVLTWGYPSKI